MAWVLPFPLFSLSFSFWPFWESPSPIFPFRACSLTFLLWAIVLFPFSKLGSLWLTPLVPNKVLQPKHSLPCLPEFNPSPIPTSLLPLSFYAGWVTFQWETVTATNGGCLTSLTPTRQSCVPAPQPVELEIPLEVGEGTGQVNPTDHMTDSSSKPGWGMNKPSRVWTCILWPVPVCFHEYPFPFFILIFLTLLFVSYWLFLVLGFT